MARSLLIRHAESAAASVLFLLPATFFSLVIGGDTVMWLHFFWPVLLIVTGLTWYLAQSAMPFAHKALRFALYVVFCALTAIVTFPHDRGLSDIVLKTAAVPLLGWAIIAAVFPASRSVD